MSLNAEPTIPINALDPEARNIAARCISHRGATKGRIKTNRPDDDEAYYVWRMVRFYASPDPRASCMPVAAAFALPHPHHEHEATCPRSTDYYASMEAAYARETGMFGADGNFRVACSCGAADLQHAAILAKKAEQQRLDAVVARILNTIPIQQQYGLRRWTRALHGVDPFNTGDITDPANHAVVTAEDELAGILL